MQKANILIAEDEAIAAAVIKDILWKLGHEVMNTASSGKMAVEMARRQHPDLILMDIKLKGDMDGITAACEIKKNIDVPIIFLTAYSDNEIIERAKAAEPSGYIIKPVEREELKSIVEIALYRHKAEFRLKQKSHEWERTFNAISDIITIHNNDYHIIQANEAAARIFGKPREEIVGRKCYEIFHAMDMPHENCPFKDVLKTGQESRREIFEPAQNKHLEITCAPISDEDGGISGFVHIVKDISERKHSEKLLEDSEAKYRTLVDMAPIAIAKTTFEGRLIMWNRETKNLLGYNEEEFLNMNIGETYIVPDHRRQLLKQLDENKVIRGFETVLKRKDGSTVPVIINAAVTRTNREKTIITMIEDITEQKKAREQQLKMLQAEKMISLGTLVSGVAHEINNPNNFIMLNTPIIEQIYHHISPLLEEKFKINGDFNIGKMPYSVLRKNIGSLITGLKDGSRRIKVIVDELRQYAQNESDSFRTLTDVNHIIDAAILLMGNNITRATLKFSVRKGKALPQIKCNPQQIEQVIINLIRNACQSLPERQSRISVSTSLQIETNMVVVSVKDEGTGMTPEILKQVKDPFFTTRQGAGGMGLGLSISDKIARCHGGELLFTSKPGKGTTAKLTLPAAEPFTV